MATKRKKRRIRAKKVSHKAGFLLFALFSGSFIILTCGLYLSSSTSTISPPIYEEIYSTTSYLGREIGRIEHAIYKSLYQGRIPEKNIHFLAVKPRHERGCEWDFVELLVKLSNSQSVRQLGEVITHELSPLRPTVSYEAERISNCGIACHIFALGFYTHKIRLVHKDYGETSYEGLPKVGLIIDDLGYDCDLAISFLELNLPLSFSILPLAPYTETIVREARKRGRELILHLPMEPKDYPSLNPGPGALLADMDERDIRQAVIEHLEQIAGVKGVNNHMGSYFTARQDKMAVVLTELKNRNLFYIDSRTTTQTVAFEVAKKMGVPVAKRSVFIDNDLSLKSIRFQMERLLGMARHSGKAIGIGHPHEETLHVLRNYLHKLKTDVRVVPVSELVG